MDRDEELVGVFLQECHSRLERATELVLALEEDPLAVPVVQEILRELHNLKGAASSAEFTGIKTVIHALEELLQPTARGRGAIVPEIVDRFEEGIDLVETMMARIRMGEDDPVADAANLASLARRGPSQAPEPVEIGQMELRVAEAGPAAAPAEVDEPPGAGLPTAGRPPGIRPTTSAGSSRRLLRPRTRATATADRGVGGGLAGMVVQAGRLDLLLAQMGDLLVTRSAVAQRHGEAVNLITAIRPGLVELATRIREWCGAGRRPGGTASSGRTPEVCTQHLLGLLDRLDATLATEEVAVARLASLCGRLEDNVHHMRMQACSTLLTPMLRTVRDLARSQGKEVHAVLSGEQTPIDRRVLDHLRAPILHLIRNAVDHGIERPDEREKRGKPTVGTVTVTVATRGSLLEITVSDDGRGVRVEEVIARAVTQGLFAAGEASVLELSGPEARRQKALGLLFLPGFSTLSEATDVSGRGMGMDAVRKAAEELGGTTTLSSPDGGGLSVAIRVPLSLVTTSVLLVWSAGQVFAIPSLAVERILQLASQRIFSWEGQEAIEWEGRALPIVRMGEPQSPPQVIRSIAVIVSAGDRIGVEIDRFVGTQDVVVKALGPPLSETGLYLGAAQLDSGAIALVLNPTGVTALARPLVTVPAAMGTRTAVCVLLVEDTLTTRTQERRILEGAGYAVVQAADGLEALERLQTEAVDLVVADVQMPRLDGIELTRRIKGSPRLGHVPVVLVTMLESVEDRRRGLDAGADAYILKGTFDQDLFLATLERLAGQARPPMGPDPGARPRVPDQEEP